MTGFNPPISAFVDSLEPRYSGPVLLLGLDGESAVVIESEGRLLVVEYHTVTVDARYDFRTQRWVDVNGVLDASQANDDTAPDGGPEIP